MESPPRSWVLVVDDDAAVRTALQNLLGAVGFRVATLPSAEALLSDPRLKEPCCLVLDLQMPGVSGLDLQSRLVEAAPDAPVVFLTAHGSVPASVRAMKQGAVDFLEKPVDPPALIEAIRRALTRGAAARERLLRSAAIGSRLELLSSRERDVLHGLVSGCLNKQIAADLGITERTVKFHRANIMAKMQAGSLAELVRMVEHSAAAEPDGD